MRQQRERNWLRISYALSKIHWASDPHCPPTATRLCGKSWPLPVPPAVHFTVPLHTTIQYYSSIFKWLKSVEWGAKLVTSGRTERTWVGRIYAHKIGTYLQRLRLDCAGAQAEWAFADRTCPTRPVFSWQFMICCYNGRVKRIDSFTSDEYELTNRAFQHFRLSDLSVRSTQTLFSLRSSFMYLLSAAFYMLQLYVPCYRNKFQCFLFLLLLFSRVWKVIYAHFTRKPSCCYVSVLSIRS